MPPVQIIHRYTAIFPRSVDAPRIPWPADVVDRVHALPDVVDVVFPDLSASWIGPGSTEDGIRVETRRRFIEVYTASSGKAAALIARTELIRLLDELRAELGYPAYTLAGCELELLEVRP